MTKGEQAPLTAWRWKALQQAADELNVARVCRHLSPPARVSAPSQGTRNRRAVPPFVVRLPVNRSGGPLLPSG
jgi:hypothetical protein